MQKGYLFVIFPGFVIWKTTETRIALCPRFLNFQELLFGDALAQRDFSDPSVEGALGPRRISVFSDDFLMNALLLRCWAATE